MFIRVIARVQDVNEDLILQNIEPPADFVWAVKYIRYDTIECFQSLDKNKTILFIYEGTPIIIKENTDKFFSRLEELIKKEIEKTDEAELTISIEDDEDEDIKP